MEERRGGIEAQEKEALPWGKVKKRSETRPAVFNGRAGDRLAAEEVARQDAYRKLIERIYGTAINAQTDVYDLALESRELKAQLEHELKGMKEVDWQYHDDGRVEAAIKVTLRQVVEVVEKTVKKVTRNRTLVEEKIDRNVREENRDRDILVIGHGALKGSEGLDRVRAMRAAEVDCYARIAAHVFGIRINANTTVRDFALSSDKISSKLCATLLNGVKFIDYSYGEDGTCEAEGQLKMREVIEVLTRTVKRHSEGRNVTIEEIENIEQKNRDTVITKTGKAIIRAKQAVPQCGVTVTRETHTIVEKVLRKEIAL